MKILVAFKRVIDPDARIKLSADNTSVDTGSVEYKANPFCENALEEAIRISEDEDDVEIVLVTIGNDDSEQQIRAGLAMGADRAIRVDAEDAELDSDLTARILSAVAKEEEPDIFLFGKQAVDGDNNQVGQLVAEYLGWPQACFASEVEIDGDSANVTREVDGGLETIKVSFPTVITADLRLNEPRYAKLPDIMKARRKTIDELDLDELGIEDTALKVEVVSLEEPPSRAAGEMVDSIETLVNKLKSEARAI